MACIVVVARILTIWVQPNPNLLPFLVRFVQIRFESESQILKKDLLLLKKRIWAKDLVFYKVKVAGDI
jgi:hypothetical protein